MSSGVISPSDDQERREHLLDVMVRVSTRDRRALTELYNLTSSKLFGITLRICGDRTGAEDVLQEVYIRIWHKADHFKVGPHSPISWLSVIARNAAIDWRRKHGNDQFVDSSVIDIIADDAPLGDVVIEDKQQEARIMYCLEQLGEEQNKPIRSAFFGGLTYSELAEQNDVPLSTIKSRIRRGLMNLKKCLEDG